MRLAITRPESAAIAEFLDCIEQAPPLAGADRLEAYSYAWFARIHESLAEDYESLREGLGEAEFERLCRDYLAAHPPSFASLARISDGLPEFLRGWRSSRLMPWHADLADLERAFCLAPFVADPEPWSLADLTEDRVESLRLLRSPGVRLLRSPWKIRELWMNGGSRARVGRDARVGDERLVVYREDFVAQVARLTRFQHELLESLASPRALPEVLEEAMKARKAEQAVRWIGEWARCGIIRPEGITGDAPQGEEAR
jgi:hypothetical protein